VPLVNAIRSNSLIESQEQTLRRPYQFLKRIVQFKGEDKGNSKGKREDKSEDKGKGEGQTRKEVQTSNRLRQL
jgi:hypothetical protein